MAPLLEARSLTKDFGTARAVDAVSFAIEKGDVMGFLGPNGAGKSTTMKMLTGFLRPTSGAAFIAGADVEERPLYCKRALGYLPEGAPAYGDMTPAGFLAFAAAARGFSCGAAREAVARAIAATHLETVQHQLVDTLSKGFKRRVGLAQAILHNPPVLVLDEPTDGLDPNQKQEMRHLIRKLSADKAIVISTHILEEVDAICSRAIVIDRGRIVADGTPADLRMRSRYHNAVSLTLADGAAGAAAEALLALPQVSGTETRKGASGRSVVTALARDGQSILDAVMTFARAEHWDVREISVDPGRLDDVFRSLTTAEAGVGTEGGAE